MSGNWKRCLLALLEYLGIVFFISFILTASFILFFQWVDIPEEAVGKSAVLTFGNALFIAFLVWITDKVRKKIMVDRPVKRILDGLEKLTGGDLTARIEPLSDPLGSSRYNIIIKHINKMADELAGVETLRTDFVSNVSHEMKTPLAVIRNYSVLLSSPEITYKERIEYAAAVGDGARRLSALINNVLKLNKLENQQIFPENKLMDLGEEVSAAVLVSESEWESKNIEIKTDMDDDVLINSDPELLGIVWQNLVSNAVKFTDTGGTISVSVKRTEDGASVSISDTGCGIDSETGRHIFEKFYQGDTSHAVQGNGLGLALVKRIIDITGGEISLSSQVGKGSTFTVKLHDRENGGRDNER